MPAKPRTRRSKVSPPPPPSSQPAPSTAHATRHRHSYSGPVPSSSKHPHTVEPTKTGPTDEDEHRITNADKEKKKLLAEVSPPGSRISWHKFVYTLAFIAFVLLAWYVYGAFMLLEEMREEVGWWGIIVGDSPTGRWRDVRWVDGKRAWGSWSRVWWGPEADGGARRKGGVESSLNALADALGIEPVQVAKAVKPFVPTESLASIAAKAEETGDVMKVLFEDTTQEQVKAKWEGVTEEDRAEEEVV